MRYDSKEVFEFPQVCRHLMQMGMSGSHLFLFSEITSVFQKPLHFFSCNRLWNTFGQFFILIRPTHSSIFKWENRAITYAKKMHGGKKKSSNVGAHLTYACNSILVKRQRQVSLWRGMYCRGKAYIASLEELFFFFFPAFSCYSICFSHKILRFFAPFFCFQEEATVTGLPRPQWDVRFCQTRCKYTYIEATGGN